MHPSFEHEYVSYDELYDAYEECRRHKWRTQNASLFSANLTENLYRLWIELNRQEYNIGPSIAFIVFKPVKREVFAADFRDRIVHHLLIRRIMPYVENEMINNSFSCRKGKGTLYGVNQLYTEARTITNNFTEKAYVLKCDLKSFFMTISKDLLYEKIDNLIKTKVHPDDEKQYLFLTDIAKKIIFNCPQYNCITRQPKSAWDGLPKDKSLFSTDEDKGLPIGNLTSQIFANYFLSDFDKFIYNVLLFEYYGRYVDDFYILSKDNERLIAAIPVIKEKLKTIGITLHPNKIYIQEISKGVKFIGSIVKPNRTYIANRTVGNLKTMVYKTVKSFEIKGENNIQGDDVMAFVRSFNSYMGFLQHHNTFNIRKKLIRSKLFEPLLKYVYFNESLTKAIPFKEYSVFGKGLTYNEVNDCPENFKIDLRYLPAIVVNNKKQRKKIKDEELK